MVAPAVTRIHEMIRMETEAARPFRALVTGVAGGLISIQRVGADTADLEPYASLTGALILEDDEVLAVNLGGQPVILGTIDRATDRTPTFTTYAASGSTGTLADSTGTDDAGLIKLVPGGSGVSSGDIFYVSFGTARPSAHYTVHLQPYSATARTAAFTIYPAARFAASFVVASDSVLSSGSTYQWLYSVRQYA